MKRLTEEEHSNNTFGWAARDSSGEKDVAFKVLYCGYCHFDLHMAKNDWGMSVYPLVPGHEIVGEVMEVGSKVEKFNVGDRVGARCVCPKSILTYGSEYHDGSITYGGYSNTMAADEHFIVHIPDNLPLDVAALMFCAGIIVYSPLRYYGLDKPGLHVVVVGLGGLGHVAVKFAKAMRPKVTVISTSPSKKKATLENLGVDSFLVSLDQDQLQGTSGTSDGIIDTVSAQNPIFPLLGLLKSRKKLVLVGGPEKPLELPMFPLLQGNNLLLICFHKSDMGSLVLY
ncbi:putative mannitol dehydrogenase [Gossypium australe]|uniref:Putative mannitol dehydrogenase n=1 Tax=Gossypium australe TaxID=47621 RepID=A0A5B6UUU1_9ROSI|nr:putative mannitol dehydrogenase [Gossypium australe]